MYFYQILLELLKILDFGEIAYSPSSPAQRFQLKSLFKILSVSQGFNKTYSFSGNF